MAAGEDRTSDGRVRAVVGPVVDDAGLFLEDVRVTRAGSRSVVRLTIDLPEHLVGSLDSDTLADTSRAVSAALDDADVVRGQYTLEVSTPGVSRPLTELRHYRRARTRRVRLTLDDGQVAEGRLTGVDGDGDDAVLVLDGEQRVAYGRVRRGRVEAELDRREDDEAGTSRQGEES
ncbi:MULTISPECIES: ribosome maturation factor RimP [Isoptericola]|uniref:Ribosome maturation factor RimP n=1 Tax=Isoptericola sediminis TaxID=2733572 RepID=A0A849KDV8_9MICO|nr:MULTISPECIES: ribosome maturation factor RimP [Isoptericola]MDO8144583.1 ribosome maturation factor RimP [Isoptericola sp. 178]MDO8148427.1 ribosome maturation factor RimP [Isoptericola sp. b515]MDO8151909.1 ribosome maturation factor RimP [Isoptericola sp. b408]NNU26763.1 ribosome maturation factor RimP [Isoptericola sediminis]